jgi:hypothetical protein
MWRWFVSLFSKFTQKSIKRLKFAISCTKNEQLNSNAKKSNINLIHLQTLTMKNCWRNFAFGLKKILTTI